MDDGEGIILATNSSAATNIAASERMNAYINLHVYAVPHARMYCRR